MTRRIMTPPRGQRTDFDQLLETEVAKATKSTTPGSSALTAVAARLRALRKDLMPAQLEFLQDPAKKKAAICTRRAGKTYVCRHMLAEAVLANPWENRRKAQPVIQYIAQTRGKALDLAWTPFKAICQDIGLEAHFDDHQLRATFPNGVLVRMGGAEDRDELEKYRGDAYVLVVVDEAASFGPRIEELIMSSLSAALMDYDGTLAMVGTPGQSQAGYFWEVYAGKHPEWSVRRWSYMTNIHFPESVRNESWVEANVGPLSSPKVQREYFGNWVSDASSIIYQYNAATAAWDGKLPAGHEFTHVLGIDPGYRDPTAFAVVAYSKTHPHLFVRHTEAKQHMLPTEIAERIVALKAMFNIQKIVMDTGGSMAKNSMVEWNRRYGFGIRAAEKKQKFNFIEHMNSEFYLGRIRVEDTQPVCQEWKTLVYADADDDGTSVRHDALPKEHPGFANHMADACLYAFRESQHYRSKEPEIPPVFDSPEYWRKQQLDAKVSAMARAKNGKKFDYNTLRSTK